MLIEADQVAVPTSDWIGVLQKDPEAIERVRTLCDGLVIYLHALSGVEAGHTLVSLRDLCEQGIVEDCTLRSR